MSEQPQRKATHFTVVYEGDIRHSGARILTGDAPPGKAVVAAVGDLHAENDALREMLRAERAFSTSLEDMLGIRARPDERQDGWIDREMRL